ncbi:predicted protein, partial [Nematostella vectensis]
MILKVVLVICLEPCDYNPCSNGGICNNTQDGRNYTCTCSSGFTGRSCERVVSLGMQNRSQVLDSQITASSTKSAGWMAKDGRLYNQHDVGVTWGCWRPMTSRADEYLQVDLLNAKTILKVATQGLPYHSTQPDVNFWVTRYGLHYSLDNVTWTSYPHVSHIFTRNSDRDTVVLHDLPVVIQARLVRFVIKEWHGEIALRADLYG